MKKDVYKRQVQVTAKTLQNKFYLFQLTPAAETTLQYTDGKGASKTFKTNRDGCLLYTSSLGCWHFYSAFA